MHVEVSDWARERIEALVANGRASCAREAIDIALVTLEASDREADDSFEDRSDEWWAELNESLEKGVAELDAGDGIPFTPELIEDIKHRGRVRLAKAQMHVG